MERISKIIALFVFIFFCPLSPVPSTLSYAAVPRLINYQGRLTDSGGAPLNGTYKLNFKLYNSAGTLLWQGTHNSVLVQKGVFSVLLGDVNDAPYNFAQLAFDEPYFLEIKVCKIEGANEVCEVLSPRQQITSSGYAFMAENTLSIPRGIIVMWSGRILDIPSDWALCDGTNGTPDLRDKFIVGARQDDGGIAKTNVSSSLTQIGGAVTANIPNHTHTVPATNTGWGQSSGQFRRGSMSTRSPDDEASYADTDLSTSNSGSSSMSLLNPYYALAFIMKL